MLRFYSMWAGWPPIRLSTRPFYYLSLSLVLLLLINWTLINAILYFEIYFEIRTRRISHCSRVFLHDLTLRHEKKKHNVCFFFPLRGGIIYQKSPLFAVSIPATLQILYTFLVHLHQPRDRCDFFSPQRISLCICILYMQVARVRVKVATDASRQLGRMYIYSKEPWKSAYIVDPPSTIVLFYQSSSQQELSAK